MVLVFTTEQPHHVQPYFHHDLHSMDQTVMAFIIIYVQMHFVSSHAEVCPRSYSQDG